MVLDHHLQPDSGRVVDETPCTGEFGRYRPERRKLLCAAAERRLTEGGDAALPVENVV
jgi:hypothetical protein